MLRTRAVAGCAWRRAKPCARAYSQLTLSLSFSPSLVDTINVFRWYPSRGVPLPGVPQRRAADAEKDNGLAGESATLDTIEIATSVTVFRVNETRRARDAYSYVGRPE